MAVHNQARRAATERKPVAPALEHAVYAAGKRPGIVIVACCRGESMAVLDQINAGWGGNSVPRRGTGNAGMGNEVDPTELCHTQQRSTSHGS